MSDKQRQGSSAVLLRTQNLLKPHQLDENDVREAYRRWAPVYDYTFGRISTAGRRHAVEIINASAGSVLEVGVGTGLSLPEYKSDLNIVGIDLAPEMLERAQERVDQEGLKNVTGLHEMDASNLQFPDGSFDTVVAMYVITVVPNPEKVMRELARVVKPGGQILLVNHFSQEEGVRGWVERRMAPFADLVGWHSVFDVSRVMVCDDLKLVERQSLRPWGLFTMMRFRKEAVMAQAPIAAE
ncbi:MAG: SAM-dependent methyltransferase [Hyphomicrobium sp.]|nr:MAG: SAM-dependent methyltransferase [Hyphomicrobium sp.]PPD01614.1 MAG: SAM-dependent methyltransferase [Hyphomicrobium sp.]